MDPSGLLLISSIELLLVGEDVGDDRPEQVGEEQNDFVDSGDDIDSEMESSRVFSCT